MRKILIWALLLAMLCPLAAIAGDMTAGNELPTTLQESYWFKGGFSLNCQDKTAAYTITKDDSCILISTTDAVTLTLPALSAVHAGQIYVIGKKGNITGTSAVTIDGSGSETIMNGSGAEATTNTQIDASGDTLVIMSTGAEWLIIGQELQ